MNKQQKKIQRDLRREVRQAYENLQYAKPWYIPQFLWDRIIAAVMNQL